MAFSMDNYQKTKDELEKKKQDAEKDWKFTEKQEAEEALLNLEKEKAEFEKLSSTEIPQNQQEQIEKLGGDLRVTEEIDKEIEEVKEDVEQEAEKVIEKEVVNPEEVQKQIAELTTEKEKLSENLVEIKKDQQKIEEEIEEIKKEQRSQHEEKMKPFCILENKLGEVRNQIFNEKIRPKILSMIPNFDRSTNPDTNKRNMDILEKKMSDMLFFKKPSNSTHSREVFSNLIKMSLNPPESYQEMKKLIKDTQHDIKDFYFNFNKDTILTEFEDEIVKKIKDFVDVISNLSLESLYKPMNVDELTKSGYLSSDFQTRLDKEVEVRDDASEAITRSLAVTYGPKTTALNEQLSEKKKRYQVLGNEIDIINTKIERLNKNT